MLFGGLAVCADALLRDRRRALWAILVVYAVSLGSELLGTTYGIPFGAYSYTSLLGIKWFERVPVLIPLSWFTVSWACWILARRRDERHFRGSLRYVPAGCLGSLARSGDEPRDELLDMG